MYSIDKLKQKDPGTLESLYLEFKDGFMGFAAKYQLEKDDLLDIYQDAFIALIENARKGRLDALQSELKTYSFSIGKYMIFKKMKEKPGISLEGFEPFPAIETEEEETDRVQKIEKAFAKLGEQCYRILMMFYYEEKKLDQIMEVMEYQSKDVLKSQKARCLKQLKDMVLL